MKQIRNTLFACSLLAAACVPSFALAEDVVAVDTKTLAPLGAEWRDENPYAGQAEAIKIGEDAFAENCARCHGLQAKSGGVAPDLRLLDRDCIDLPSASQKQACFKETDKYFLFSIRYGKVRNGNVYMPPFGEYLSQEAMWAIKAYLASLRTNQI